MGSNSIFGNSCKEDWVHKKCSWLKYLTKDPNYRWTWCQGAARSLDGRPQRKVQVEPDTLEVVVSFCYLGDMLSAAGSCEVSTTTALVCGAQSSMPVRFGHWQSQTSNVFRKMTGQWSDRSAMSSCKTLLSPDPSSFLCGLVLRIWTSFWRSEGSAGMDMRNAQKVQSRQPLTYRLMESVDWGNPRWLRGSWQRGFAESGGYGLSTLMMTYLEIRCENCHAWSKPAIWKGTHWRGCCPCTCRLIKKPMMMIMIS